MLIGNKGVKYGLTVPKPKPKAPVPKPVNIFGEDDDSGDEAHAVGKDIARQGARKLADTKVKQLHEQALAEDASAFAYDEVYDSIKAERVQPRQAEKLQRKSRYIASLMDKAVERKKEEDIVYERRLAKEREAEDHLFGDKEKFVTAAYKRKLQEDKVWLAAEKAREEAEAANDVVKRGHMGDFYRNVMTKNVAFGGASEEAAGTSKREDPSEPAAAAPSRDAAWEAARTARQRFEETTENAATPPNGAVPGPDVGRGGSGEAGRAAEEAGAGPGEGIMVEAAPAGETSGDTRPLPGGERGDEAWEKAAGLLDSAVNPVLAKQAKLREAALQREKDLAEKARAKEEEERLAASAAVPMSKEDRAAAARERYLARKRKAPGDPA